MSSLSQPSPRVRPVSQLTPRTLTWLWQRRLALGKLAMLDGDPGLGKSLVALDRELDPDMEVDVEILDVSEDEARALLLSIDPLAALAETQEQIHQRLLELAPVVSEDIQAAWQAAADASLAARDEPTAQDVVAAAEQYLVLVKWRDEKQQVALIQRLQSDGWECKALLS